MGSMESILAAALGGLGSLLLLTVFSKLSWVRLRPTLGSFGG